MSTAHKSEEEKKEYFDTPDVLEQKCQELAKLIKESKHFVAFTGAGISTSAGIADFRSGVNTVLPTGPGVWEKAAVKGPVAKPKVSVAMHAAIPTPTHMALVALEQKKYLKYLISQNVDGLHLKSGFPASKMAELHGNTNLEICSKCKKRYLRDFRVRTAKTVHDHKTGRLCDDPKCRGELNDSIINFGENLPAEDMGNGFKNSEMADLHLCMGSSLRVTPAANMPESTAEHKGKLVIINLQSTPLDKLASLRIYALVDDVVRRVMQILDVPIPDFVLTRRFGLSRNTATVGKTVKERLILRGLDEGRSPYSFFKSVAFHFSAPAKKSIGFEKEPYLVSNEVFDTTAAKGVVNLEFQGHYAEPDFKFEFDFSTLKGSEEKVFEMKYHPATRKWISFVASA